MGGVEMKQRNERGFTLMELMVVIVIVAILAAVAVPLYINYVKDAQRTEAKGAIGAIISAEQVYYQKSAFDPTNTTGAPTYTDLATLKSTNAVDLTEPETKWTFSATGTTTSFTVGATNKSDPTLGVTYSYDRSTGKAGEFEDKPPASGGGGGGGGTP
jgi:prepilin-type N-terminal cleavage/methylation domain-containing protein